MKQNTISITRPRFFFYVRLWDKDWRLQPPKRLRISQALSWRHPWSYPSQNGEQLPGLQCLPERSQYYWWVHRWRNRIGTQKLGFCVPEAKWEWFVLWRNALHLPNYYRAPKLSFLYLNFEMEILFRTGIIDDQIVKVIKSLYEYSLAK